MESCAEGYAAGCARAVQKAVRRGAVRRVGKGSRLLCRMHSPVIPGIESHVHQLESPHLTQMGIGMAWEAA